MVAVRACDSSKVNKTNCIEIVTPNRTFYLAADTSSDFQNWLTIISTVFKSVHPEAAKVDIDKKITTDLYTVSKGSMGAFNGDSQCSRMESPSNTAVQRERKLSFSSSPPSPDRHIQKSQTLGRRWKPNTTMSDQNATVSIRNLGTSAGALPTRKSRPLGTTQTLNRNFSPRQRAGKPKYVVVGMPKFPKSPAPKSPSMSQTKASQSLSRSLPNSPQRPDLKCTFRPLPKTPTKPLHKAPALNRSFSSREGISRQRELVDSCPQAAVQKASPKSKARARPEYRRCISQRSVGTSPRDRLRGGGCRPLPKPPTTKGTPKMGAPVTRRSAPHPGRINKLPEEYCLPSRALPTPNS